MNGSTTLFMNLIPYKFIDTVIGFLFKNFFLLTPKYFALRKRAYVPVTVDDRNAGTRAREGTKSTVVLHYNIIDREKKKKQIINGNIIAASIMQSMPAETTRINNSDV